MILVLPEASRVVPRHLLRDLRVQEGLPDRPTELARQRDSRADTGSTPTPQTERRTYPCPGSACSPSGVASRCSFIIGWFASGGDAPDYGASDQAWTDWADDNQWKSRIGAVAMLLAGFVFLHFAGMIRSVLGRAESPVGGSAQLADCLRRSRNGHDRNGYRHRHHRFVGLEGANANSHHEGGRECVGRSILGFGDGVCGLPRGCGTPDASHGCLRSVDWDRGADWSGFHS